LNSIGIATHNITNNLHDGRILMSLCNIIKPGTIDSSQLGDDQLGNLSLVITAAENSLNIPRLLDAEDILNSDDPLSNMTYLSYFREAIETLPNYNDIIAAVQSPLASPTSVRSNKSRKGKGVVKKPKLHSHNAPLFDLEHPEMVMEIDPSPTEEIAISLIDDDNPEEQESVIPISVKEESVEIHEIPTVSPVDIDEPNYEVYIRPLPEERDYTLPDVMIHYPDFAIEIGSDTVITVEMLEKKLEDRIREIKANIELQKHKEKEEKKRKKKEKKQKKKRRESNRKS